MTLAYTRDSAGTGDNILELELVRNERHRNTEQDFNFRGWFLCKANVSSEEKIKVFGKSTVAIHSLILR